VNLEATVAAQCTGVSLSSCENGILMTSSLHSVVQIMMVASNDGTFVIFFSYLKCQDELCQKL